MYAVFSTGGKQYRAAQGDVLRVEKLNADEGATIEIDQVLMVGQGDDVRIGTPVVEGGKVTPARVGPDRGQKIRILNDKRRTYLKPKIGHRHHTTEIKSPIIEG